jgi:hypothetical protein
MGEMAFLFYVTTHLQLLQQLDKSAKYARSPDHSARAGETDGIDAFSGSRERNFTAGGPRAFSGNRSRESRRFAAKPKAGNKIEALAAA